MALILPSRATRIAQPQGPVELSKDFGLDPIGLFLGSAGFNNLVDNQRFTVGSAASIRAGAVGLGVLQNAVNTGIYEPVALQSRSSYTLIWHGVPIGTPGGTGPNFTGLTNSTATQGAGALGLEYSNSTTLSVYARSGATGFNRTGTFTWANTFSKPTTLIASCNSDTDTLLLHLCVDGGIQEVINTTVGGMAPPTITGTEQFIVGPDVPEQATRHINSNVALAGVFYGQLYDSHRESILRNPWQLFRPIQRRIIVDMGAGGGTGATASATPATVTTTAPAATATGSASASATPAQVTATAATATATGSASAQATPAAASTTPSTGAATGAALAASAPASVQLTPATATASGESGASVEATATPAPITTAPATATATGSASAQATPAQVTTTAPTATVGSGASASATLAALGLMPATGTATGGAAATALPAQIIITPATGSAKGGAQAYSTPAPISITPATGTASEYIKPIYSDNPSSQSVDYPLRVMAVRYPAGLNQVDYPLRVLQVNYPKQ